MKRIAEQGDEVGGIGETKPAMVAESITRAYLDKA